MAVHIEKESLETERIEILNGLRNIQKKDDFKSVRLILNVDGSGEIQGYNPKSGLAFNQVRAFKNFDELYGIFSEYFFA